MKNFLLRIALLVLLAGPTGPVFAAAPYLGRPLVDVINEVRAEGYEIAYSSRLVPRDLTVPIEPVAIAPLSALLEILQSLDLNLHGDEGVFLIIRDDKPKAAPVVAGQDREPAAAGQVEMIVVSASRYEISRDLATSALHLDQRTIETMPDVGDDPVRIVQRLPGAAASGASARTHLRGGEEGEVGIILNGQRLFDPFHVRDYQSIFSAVDSRAIEGVEVYTGGFPVRYGDRMSGLVLMESIDPDKLRHNEIGISVFNTSLLYAGRHADKRWLVSGRRGNLDLVIDDELGEPSYSDVFGRFEMDLGSSSRLSANALYADDQVLVVLESDPAELEQVESTTRNFQAWLQLDSEWSDRLTSRTAVSYTKYDNRRIGMTDDPEKLVSNVSDVRSVERIGFRQDWSFQPAATHFTQWGFSVAKSNAKYDYLATAEYFGLLAMYQGQPQTLSRALKATPAGANYALYLADRWALTPKTTLEWGLRWDDQTYTDRSSDAQLSPRISLLYRWSDATDLRASWGRYHQAQGVHELQVEDGIDQFWPAQRADHLIVGMQHRFPNRMVLRIEAFHKDMSEIRPRYENLFDPLALIPELLPDRVLLAPDSARSIGTELSLEGERGAWSWWASYTLSKVSDAFAGQEQARSWDQRHAAQAGVTWANEKWDFAVAAGAHSGWPTTTLNLVDDGVDEEGAARFVVVPGPRNAEQLNTFFSLDLRLSRRFAVRRGALTAFIEVANITNRRNVCCVDWDVTDDPGRTELEPSNDYWLPLLPAIGVLWEF